MRVVSRGEPMCEAEHRVVYSQSLQKERIILRYLLRLGRLGNRVVSLLDSGTEWPGFRSQSRRCRVTVLGTHRASVHQAVTVTLAAALLRVTGVTEGLAESNGNLPPGL